MKKTLLSVSLLCAAAAVFAGPASAATAPAAPAAPLTITQIIIQDCTQDSVLNGTYSRADLQAALALLQGDTVEYGQCQSVISQALNGSATHKNKSSGGNGSGLGAGLTTSAVKAQTTAIARQIQSATKSADSKPIPKVGGPAVTQSGKHTLASSTAPGIPTALVIALVGMLLLFAADPAGRVAKLPQMAFLTKILPKNRRSGPIT